MSRQKVDRINACINTNRHLFVPGTVISEQQFCTMMQIPVQRPRTIRAVGRYNYKKLSAYTALNRLLEKRGLYIKSHNYGTEYHVLGGEDARKQSKSFRKQAQYKETNADNLEHGIKLYKSNWRSLRAYQKDAAFQRIKHTLDDVNL